MKKLITLIFLLSTLGLFAQRVVTGDIMQLRPMTLPSGTLGQIIVQASDSTANFYNGSEWVDLSSGTGSGGVFFQSGARAIYPESISATSLAAGDSSTVVKRLYLYDKKNTQAVYKAGFDVNSRLVHYGKISELNLSAFDGDLAELNDTLTANTEYTTIVVDTSITLTANWTIPSGVDLRFEKGNVITTGSDTLFGNGATVYAGMYQIFSLTSNVENLTPFNAVAYPEWFDDGSRTKDEAIQKAVNTFTNIAEVGKAREVGVYPYNDLGDLTEVQPNTIKLLADSYLIDSTIHLPQYCIFEGSGYNAILGDTTNFYDSYISIDGDNVKLRNLTFLVRTFSEMEGYATSAKDSAAKVEWAYNKNPVILWKWWEKGDRYDNRDKAEFSDLRIKHVGGGYGGSISWNPDLNWYYDGIFVYADTTSFTGGAGQLPLRVGYYYYFSDYVTGDDFTNVGATVGTQIDGGQFLATGTTPTTWTNGSVIKPMNGQNIFNSMNDISIANADTGIYLDGGPELREYDYKKMCLSWTLNSLITDQCITGLVLGVESFEMSITNYQNQSSDIGSEAGYYSMIVDGGANYISGAFSDFNYFSNRRILVTGLNNVINMAFDQRNGDDYGDVTREGESNWVGPTPLWRRTKDGTQSNQSYWFLANKMGIKEYGNTSVDTELVPTTQLDIIGATSSSSLQPLMLLELANSGVRSDGKLIDRSGFAGALAINDRIASPQIDVRPSSGASIDFFVNNNPDTTGNYSTYQLGKVGFRQDYNIGYMSTTGPRGAFQVWNNNNGTWTPGMTITSDGKMGLNGVTQPAYTLDLVGSTTHNVGGALKAGTFRSDNMVDDGTDVTLANATVEGVTTFDAGINVSYQTLTTSANIGDGKYVYLEPGGVGQTYTLQTGADYDGREYYLINTTAIDVTIAVSSGSLAGGSATLSAYETAVVHNRGTASWYLHSRNVKD